MERQIVKPLPPSYKGQPWTNRLLHALSAAELHRLIHTYGANQINAAAAMNATRGVK